jgi:hypothetical protein
MYLNFIYLLLFCETIIITIVTLISCDIHTLKEGNPIIKIIKLITLY